MNGVGSGDRCDVAMVHHGILYFRLPKHCHGEEVLPGKTDPFPPIFYCRHDCGGTAGYDGPRCISRKYVDAGTVIVMGPVLDPAGPRGLAVFEAGSEEEVRTIIARDPTVLSGLGFRWEISPMLQAVVRNQCRHPHPRFRHPPVEFSVGEIPGKKDRGE